MYTTKQHFAYKRDVRCDLNEMMLYEPEEMAATKNSLTRGPSLHLLDVVLRSVPGVRRKVQSIGSQCFSSIQSKASGC